MKRKSIQVQAWQSGLQVLWRIVFCILTDSGRRSTLIWSPSSKPSGTLFCINKGMFKFRTFSGWEPFCHCSSCRRESRNKGTVPLNRPTIYSENNRRIPRFWPSISSFTAWESTESLSWPDFAPFPSLCPCLFQRFFTIRGMMRSLGFSDCFALQDSSDGE